MRVFRFFLAMLCIIPFSLASQELLPPIYNHKISEYNAAGKNWGLAVDETGELFMANNEGLLHYNGEEWILNRLPNKTIVRSAAYLDGKVFTGSYEEFGYWTKNKWGQLTYTSLTHLIKDHTFSSEEFWEIIKYKGSIVFRSFAAIYRYENDTITVVKPPFVISDMLEFEDKLLIAGGQNGLFQLSNDTLLPINTQQLLSGKTVTDMAVLDDRLLIGTKLNGCYLFDGNDLHPWQEPLNDDLKLHQLNKLLVLSSGELVFGTIKNGLYLYDGKQKRTRNINREAGLQNNTVLSLSQFQNRLWVGLDNGLDQLQINTPITYYTQKTGTLGTVYDLAFHKGALYLGSNTGVYYFQNDQLNFVHGSQGHVWDLKNVGGELLAGHNTGTFKINGNRLEKISDIAGGYQLIAVPESENTFLQGTYTGIAKYEKGANESWQITKIKGIGFPIKQLCFEDANTVWGAHPYKGLFRFQLNDELTEIVETREFGTDIIPNTYNIRLYRIKNQIVVQSEGLWYHYDPIMGKIAILEPFKAFENNDLIYTNGSAFWFLNGKNDKEIRITDIKGKQLSVSEPVLKQRLVSEGEKVLKQNDSVYLLTLSDGFGSINLSQLRRQSDTRTPPVPKLAYFKDEETGHPIDSTSFYIKNRHAREIQLQVAAPSITRPKYFYELHGPTSKSELLAAGTILFQNMPHGTYQIDIYTMDMGNKKSAPLVIHFEIAPPWYLSKVSIALYLMALVGVVFLIRAYNRLKLRRKHKKLKERLQKEQEERLAQLEKEKLEKEIKQKQKELARTTMSVARKNELILELKEMLLLHKNEFSNKQRYRSLTKKLDNSINKDEDWKHFEVNFKELHEDFFENLLGKFPDLTPKDLKLCAYLKMNLSSKEIAPLMGITIRGVEIHRYRLRKKLRIESSQNLSNFLIKFN